ncbi:hypothetical protein WV31_13350 [Magnetospirillum sp. ME-1]|uniref:hypothetical protein n=1 Tax=Magnetospirillum sp. ME-1 TaxID=1639348 RepID=UPI000A17C9F7|nr:hypothetical protein [Magnetospirillum sp. ME-1]ARJ66584.1 hypothetical protein WV31_13350 [Magnetospirillum sp. ME-1]
MSQFKLFDNLPATLAQISIEPVAIVASVLAVAGIAMAGRVVSGRESPAVAFAAGMGGFVTIGTLVGVAGLDLRLALAALLLVAVVRAWRDRRDLSAWRRLCGPVLLMLLPLLLLLSGRQGSEWDEFSHWLHAFRYLAVNHVLPGGPGVPVMDSCCAAYPYAWPMVGMAAMSLSGFSEAVPALLNTLLLGLFATLLLDLADEDRRGGTITLPVAAIAALAATLASPTFVAKLAFSAYADVLTAFMASILLLTGESVAGDDGEREGAWSRALSFGLAAAALMAAKPGNAALFGCALGGAMVLSLRNHGWRGLLRPHWLAMVAPPLVCLLVWRWHVSRYLQGQEMVFLPFEKWHVAQIGQILLAMLDVAVNKGGHFLLGFVMVGLGLLGLVRNRGRLDRLCAMAGMMFVGYNLFLLMTYVTVFGDYEALHAASFWRYNTHIGLALMLPAAILGARLLRHLARRFAWTGVAGWGVVGFLVVGPVILATQIRFDADPMKVFLRRSLAEAATLMPPGAKAVVIDPFGSGVSAMFATYEWSGRARLDSFQSAFNSEMPRAWLARQQAEWAFVASGQSRLGLLPETAAQLMRREGTEWVTVRQFPYPGNRVPESWP